MAHWEPWALVAAAILANYGAWKVVESLGWTVARVDFPLVEWWTLASMVMVGITSLVMAASLVVLIPVSSGKRGIDLPLLGRMLPAVLTATGIMVGMNVPLYALMGWLSAPGPITPLISRIMESWWVATDAAFLLAAWYLFGTEAALRGRRAPGMGALVGPGLLVGVFALAVPRAVNHVLLQETSFLWEDDRNFALLFFLHSLFITTIPIFAALCFYGYLGSGEEEARPKA